MNRPAGTGKPVQHILVCQQNGAGERKIAGIREHGGGEFRLEVVDIDAALPPFIEDPGACLPDLGTADLVLDFLQHPDLTHELARLCREKNIPLIASSKKLPGSGALTPPVCCALPRRSRLGAYGERFGAPEYRAIVEQGRVRCLEVIRGAACGASWDALGDLDRKLAATPLEEVPVAAGLAVQFHCVANPAGWDPISGKSPVHLAAELHRAAVKKAIDAALRKG